MNAALGDYMKKIILLMGVLLFSPISYSKAYQSTQVEFASRGTTLSGSIVIPAQGKVRAAVVFVHGSGPQTRNIGIAGKFAEHGIAALVYDKRGVGQSGGEYESKQSVSEHNISLLADDTIAALNELAKQNAIGDAPVGLVGISQAGWIIPLAAEKSAAAEATATVDFMVLWSGPVSRVSEEDIFSKFTADLDTKEVPSYEQALKSRTSEYVWPSFLGKDTDPSESLEKLKIPGLWVFGKNDGSIPVDLSIQRLEKFNKSAYSYDYVLFSRLGHNNIPETFATVIDWILRRVEQN